MNFVALATDYDDTIADGSIVDEETFAALLAVKRSGRRLILVTGRELDDLLSVFPGITIFDQVVAENGALLFDPLTNEETPLAPPPDGRIVDALRRAGVSPLSVGRAIIATREPHENTVLDAIRESGLELKIVFNKGAVMILPAGIQKASGLVAALDRMGLSAHNVVGIGDAENDHAFLHACGFAVAVSNALPALKAHADLVTDGARGAGLMELAKLLIDTDLRTTGFGPQRRMRLEGR